MQGMTPSSGVALIFSLMVVALLSVLIIEASFLARVDANIIGNWENERRAYYLAKGGVNLGITVLKKDVPGVDSRLETWAKPVPPLPVGEGVVELEISDEDGKININKMVDKNGKLDAELIRVAGNLFARYADDMRLLPCLLDHIDSDTSVRSGGSEDGAKNRPLETKAEICAARKFRAAGHAKLRLQDCE